LNLYVYIYFFKITPKPAIHEILKVSNQSIFSPMRRAHFDNSPSDGSMMTPFTRRYSAGMRSELSPQLHPTPRRLGVLGRSGLRTSCSSPQVRMSFNE